VLELRKAESSDLPFLIALRRETMWSHFENSGVPIDQAFQLERVLYRFAMWARLRSPLAVRRV
jgi:hypothetical protein